MDDSPDTWEGEDGTVLPEGLAAAVLGQLTPGECVVWYAQPRMEALFWLNLGFFLLVGLFGLLGLTPLLVRGILAMFMAVDSRILQHHAMQMVPLMALPVPALCLLAWALLRTRKRVRNTAYVLTNRRAVIVSTRPTWKVAAYAPADLISPRLCNHRGGLADIVLATGKSAKAHGPTWNTMYGLTDPQRVMELIHQLVHAGENRTPG